MGKMLESRYRAKKGRVLQHMLEEGEKPFISATKECDRKSGGRKKILDQRGYTGGEKLLKPAGKKETTALPKKKICTGWTTVRCHGKHS